MHQRDLRRTVSFWRSRLPHWEVEGAVFFITIRCSGSLPGDVVKRISDLRDSICAIEPQSETFERLQRTIFATAEKYLDQGLGFAPFRDPDVCDAFAAGFEIFAKDTGWNVHGYTVLPNHCHLLVSRRPESGFDLEAFLKRLKGRTARTLNLVLSRSGPFWQRDWFDRWIRSEAELERTIAYIKNNPVKARIVSKAEEYRHTKFFTFEE